MSTQQYIQLNTGIKEIQQLNPRGPKYRHNISEDLVPVKGI